MRATRYFLEQVRRKRPYLEQRWIEETLSNPITMQRQPDGRIRFWRYIPALGRHLRVMTLADGVTVHNAFPDRSFQGGLR